MWISDLMWQIHKTSKRPVVRRNDLIGAINLIPERNLAENDLKQHFNLCPFLGVNQKKRFKNRFDLHIIVASINKFTACF